MPSSFYSRFPGVEEGIVVREWVGRRWKIYRGFAGIHGWPGTGERGSGKAFTAMGAKDATKEKAKTYHGGAETRRKSGDWKSKASGLSLVEIP